MKFVKLLCFAKVTGANHGSESVVYPDLKFREVEITHKKIWYYRKTQNWS